MSKSGYLPNADAERLAWFRNFNGKIALYATLLGLTAAEIAIVAADLLMVIFVLQQLDWFRNESMKWTSYKNALFTGEIGSQLGVLPVLTDPAAAPAAVPAGVFKRTAKLVQRIKNHTNYTEAIGNDLGVESHVITQMMEKPDLKVTLESGHPSLKWTKGSSTSAEVFVDRDGKGFASLAIVTQPRYSDTYQLPAAPTKWSYKVSYRYLDEPIGDISDPVSVVVSTVV